ncbi:MAG TPA: hypothetical protein VM056_02000 [Terriglobales bacterium]|nr:hypothetical protein [Terriglobales bacterium]
MTEPYTNPNELDEQLDAGLKAYSDVCPREGLEGRVLANLRTAPEESAWSRGWFTSPRLAWMTTVLLAGGIGLGMFLISQPGLDDEEEGDDSAIQIHLKAKVETLTAALPHVIEFKNIPSTARPRMPKILDVAPVRSEVFPAPAPLSEQERMALSYARVSQGRMMAAVRLPESGIRELEVPALQMAPLRVEELERPGTDSGTQSNTNK